MEHPADESDAGALRVDFDRRWRLEFHGSRITSDARLLPYRALDDVLGRTDLAGAMLTDGRRGKNTRHLMAGLLRQSVFSRVPSYRAVAQHMVLRISGFPGGRLGLLSGKSRIISHNKPPGGRSEGAVTIIF